MMEDDEARKGDPPEPKRRRRKRKAAPDHWVKAERMLAEASNSEMPAGLLRLIKAGRIARRRRTAGGSD